MGNEDLLEQSPFRGFVNVRKIFYEFGRRTGSIGLPFGSP